MLAWLSELLMPPPAPVAEPPRSRILKIDANHRVIVDAEFLDAMRTQRDRYISHKINRLNSPQHALDESNLKFYKAKFAQDLAGQLTRAVQRMPNILCTDEGLTMHVLVEKDDVADWCDEGTLDMRQFPFLYIHDIIQQTCPEPLTVQWIPDALLHKRRRHVAYRLKEV